ncbi:MAG: biotin attachment protein [Deltaproteobacteria bacterium]|nr:biotin attachment protein [Deltaproteobacteria bacterium]
MIFTSKPKKIRVMLTAFRDGLQSSFGGKARVADILPAMEAAAAAGMKHLEFGGGARYQAPFFYVGEDPFACMDKMRAAVGKDTDLQILTRSVSGVTLTTQRLPALEMQAKLMAKHGTTWDRNFDFQNDADNLAKTGKSIVDAGMHHQVCVALMGLPFKSDRVHTADFYVNVIKRFLKHGVHFDSICMKDASGTTDPKTCYETAKGLRKLLGPDALLWMHTHDTASMAVACYMAGIEGGVDGIDLSVRPMASGTVQPDIRSMWHALKGTGYSLDINHAKAGELEDLLNEGMKDYDFNPVTTTADARVVDFPMPGGAIGPNVHMMKEAGILDRYSEVLAEFPVVVKAGGAWTSVTPGSQQYWLQAFSNVLNGRWKKINPGYGKSVLGYFGRTPLPPDPSVVKIAAKQLELEPFDGDPLEAAPDSLSPAKQALEERGLKITDENIFLVASAIVPGKKMNLNEGIKFLTGKAKIVLPLKKKEATAKAAPAPATPALPTGPVTTTCEVVEGGVSRSFKVTIAMPGGAGAGKAAPAKAAAKPAAAPSGGNGAAVYSPFDGKAELVDIKVKVGDSVKEGDVVALVEAMKAQHDVRAPCAGKVTSIDADEGDDVMAGVSIITIGG